MSSAVAEPSMETSTGIPNARLGMWIFLASEIMFFTGLIGSYIVLRLGSESWPDPGEVLNTPLLGLNTFILITSSLTMVQALSAVKRGDQARLKINLGLTILGGVVFLGIKLWDYNHMIHEGFTISSSLFGSFYYMLTGFHGLHVFGGVVALICIWTAAAKGRYSASSHDAVEGIGLYWHFVDLVWIILFAILCLV
jgi:heme/copper-type cytochrome/quinol oxidase subunit 3